MTREGKNLSFLNILTGFFVASLLLANAVSAKIIALGPFSFPAGTVIFPLSFVFGDILTEVYGYPRARRVIWIGSACQVLAAFMYLLAGWLPSAPFWYDQKAYETIRLRAANRRGERNGFLVWRVL